MAMGLFNAFFFPQLHCLGEVKSSLSPLEPEKKQLLYKFLVICPSCEGVRWGASTVACVSPDFMNTRNHEYLAQQLLASYCLATARCVLACLIGNWPFSYDTLALSIRASQEMKPRHPPRFSEVIRGYGGI